MSNFTSYVKRTGSGWLTAFGIIAGIGSTVLACIGTVKAVRVVDDMKAKQAEDICEEHEPGSVPPITKKDIVKSCWKFYIPAVSCMVASSVMLIGSTALGYKREAAATTAYLLAEKTLDTYRDNVIDKIGPDEEKDIHDKTTQQVMDERKVKNSEVVIVKKDGDLCYEPYSGRYFVSDAETIRAAINSANQQLMNEDYITLNDVYYLLGLSETLAGQQYEWHSNYGLIDVDFTSMIGDVEHDRKPCLVIDFRTRPRVFLDYAE